MKNKKSTAIAKEIRNHILNVYFFLIICILPIYINDGYTDIGAAKVQFYLLVTLISLAIFLIWKIAEFIKNKEFTTDIAKRIKNFFLQCTLTEKLLFAYLVTITLSFLFSDYKDTVLWGEITWNLGFITMTSLCVIALVIPYIWQGNPWIFTGIAITSGFCFLHGICNRFSIYPITIEPQIPGFISTLGNINWFCGYMAVVAPIGIGIYIFASRKKHDYFWVTYAFISFFAGFCQGSSSVYLYFGALFGGLLWICIENKKWLLKWMILLILWSVSAQIIRFLRFLFPDAYNYDANVFITSSITIYVGIFAVAGIIYLLYQEKKAGSTAGLSPSHISGTNKNYHSGTIGNMHSNNPTLTKVVRIVVPALVIIGCVLFVVLTLVNTRYGIPALQNNSLFLFNESWGNGRGNIYQISVTIWHEMSPLQKLFGVGPDGYAIFAYSQPELSEYLISCYGISRLTNAHCEIITTLINHGLAGCGIYISLLGTFIYRCFKHAKKNSLLYIPAICIICYFTHNMISFAQILNLPYVFILMGMGEYWMKKCS